MKCPKCGNEVNGNFCSNCGTPLSSRNMNINNSSFNNQMGYKPPLKKKSSLMGIFGFVLSFLGPLALIGIILAIIDLITDKQKHFKHGLSIAAIIIGSIMLFSSCASMMNSSRSNKSSHSNAAAEKITDTPTTVTPTTEAQTEVQTTEVQTTEAPRMTKEEFMYSCLNLNDVYKSVAREPSKYIGQNFEFTCYVISSREAGFFSGYQKYFVTVAYDFVKAQDVINRGWANNYSDAMGWSTDFKTSVWLMDNRNEDDSSYIKILESDVITVYGTFEGMTETKNNFTGESGEVVSLDIKYVDILS
ncbi:hypothetical protein BXO88_15015 [Oribacterium sp. C9]|uniref:zinc ribbon domain-containing protein n=1 Tax=Oribacterium sp. C9 TaxID=1943579 RepID=UPI00098EB2E6|nr:zinc ribbon domain-containing protein [Oribacterium sp. C9]OON84884.1 hypothetical protein BXO88_15015 [Oribacterium sp. C9]